MKTAQRTRTKVVQPRQSTAAPGGRGRGEAGIALLMIFPSVGLLAALFMLPVLIAIYNSFFAANTLTGERSFVGVDNYTWLLTDPAVRAAFVRSLIWTVLLVTGEVALGLALAIGLYRKFAGRGIFQAMVVFPYIVPAIAVALIWRYVMEPTSGVLNHILMSVGIVDKPIPWLSSPDTALAAVILIGIWKYTPFMVLLFLARLQSVPRELYEAVSIDGGGAWARFRHVTVPWIMPVLMVAVILRGIWGFNEFDIVYLAAEGGPLNATTTIPVLIRETAFSALNIGRASAIAIGMAVFLVVLIGLGLRTYRRRSEKLS